jgi:predicted MPP superfamily phosphohydrolase
LRVRADAVQLAYLLAWFGALAWPVLIGFAVWRWITKRSKPKRAAWIALGVVTPFWFLGIWAFLWEPETLVVRRIEVVSLAWSGPPLRIGVIADTHMGAPHMSVGRMKRLVARMNSEHPDVVTLLGDYIGGHAPAASRSNGDRAAIVATFQQMGRFHAPLGTYAVLGNHDIWYDAGLVAAGLDAAGVHLLQNQSIRVERGAGSFWIAGLTDHDAARAPSYTQSMLGVPATDPLIALVHRPDKFAAAPAQVALTLAGHTHCGQVHIPFLGRYMPKSSEESRRWPCGLYEDHGRRLYVSGGVGVSFLPVRFLQPPEIAIVTLRADPDAEARQIRAPAPAPPPPAPAAAPKAPAPASPSP